MYSLHDVEVVGLDLGKILECEIESQIGEHSTLSLHVLIDDEEFLYGIPDCREIEVILQGGSTAESLFSGIVTAVSMNEDGQVKTAWIEGKSRSWLLDREKHSRSFQDGSMGYRALVKEVLKGYKGQYDEGSLRYVPTDREIGVPLVQYEETDWAFLKRVLSREGITITPDSRGEGKGIFAGAPCVESGKVPFRIVEAEKDMGSYYALKACGRSVHAAEFTKYKIASEHLLGIFSEVEIEGHPYSVYSYRYSFVGHEMEGLYSLQSPEGLTVVPSYPMQLIGAAMAGKITAVSGTKVRAALKIDGGHTERAVHWFPYSTLSASPDGSGWYCMPEIGDSVMIYFPSKHEEEAVALSAVSNYVAPKGGRDRMADPNSRYLRNRFGQELMLCPEYARLSCGGETSQVTVLDSGRIDIVARDKVTVEAQETIYLHAEEDVSFRMANKFEADSTDGGQLICYEDKVYMNGTKVRQD
jgi:hypothetical protein